MPNWIDACSCDCYEPRGCECPDIIGSGQVTIDTSTEGVLEVNAPENPTVTSDDGSIDITETTNSPWSINYDLSVNASDSKVWGCDTDQNPSTLNNKLFVDSPLTKTVEDCMTDGKVVLWLDTSLLQDEKVKVASWCTAWYLEDLIEWEWGVRVYRDWCTLKIDADQEDFAIPMIKVMLWADYVVTKSHDIQEDTENEWWFFIPTDQSISNDPWRTDWLEYQDIVTSLWPVRVININKSWYYRVSFNFNADINYWINAMRWCVFSNMSWKNILLDDKLWEPTGYAIAHQATWDAASNLTYAKQVSFSRSDTTYLDAWTSLYLWWRISPYVIHWPWSWMDAWAKIYRAWLAGGTLWLWPALENSEAWCVLTVQRVSNPDWWVIYE